MSYSPVSDNALLLLPAIVAATAVVGLTVAQSDQFSRRFLKPEKLQAKRQQEYRYRWEQANDKAVLRAHMYLAGGVDAHEHNLSTEEMQRRRRAPLQRISTIWDEDGLKALISEWIREQQEQQQRLTTQSSLSGSSSTTSTPFPYILGLVREEDGGGGVINHDASLLLELYHPNSGTYQLPLDRFGLLLASMESVAEASKNISFCFVADASSGLANQLVADLIEASKAGVAIVREPVWMTCFAAMVTERVINQDEIPKILFGLCRLEALRVGDQIGDAKTVLFTLPGQATTPILVPLLQKAFPKERHIFGYQSCVQSVERAMALRSSYKRATVPLSLDEAVSYSGCGGGGGGSVQASSSSDPTRFTTPMRSGLTKSIDGLAESLAALRLYHADTVQAWMGSVDTYYKLEDQEEEEEKEEGSTTNKKGDGYAPYTLKLELLIGDPNATLEPESERYHSLRSLIQFVVTGGGQQSQQQQQQQSLPQGVMDAAKEWLRDFTHQLYAEIQNQTKLTQLERNALEVCVSKHKSISSQDATLKDTVLPS